MPAKLVHKYRSGSFRLQWIHVYRDHTVIPIKQHRPWALQMLKSRAESNRSPVCCCASSVRAVFPGRGLRDAAVEGLKSGPDSWCWSNPAADKGPENSGKTARNVSRTETLNIWDICCVHIGLGFLCSCFFCLLGLWDWWWHSECHGWKWRKTLSENLKQLKSQQENTTRRSPRGSPRRGHFLKRSKVTRNVIKDDVWMMYVTFGQSWHLAEHHPSIIFSRFHGLMIYVSWFA